MENKIKEAAERYAQDQMGVDYGFIHPEIKPIFAPRYQQSFIAGANFILSQSVPTDEELKEKIVDILANSVKSGVLHAETSKYCTIYTLPKSNTVCNQ